MEKVIVSGVGIVSALGVGKDCTLQALRQGESGIAKVRYLQTEHVNFPVGEVKLTNEEMMDLLGIEQNTPHTRTSLMGMLAVREALQNAGLLDMRCETNLKIAFINGTTVGGMDKTEQYYLDFLSNSGRDDYIAIHDCGACSEQIADYFGTLFSHVQTISTACSSAANAIMAGAMLLKNGKADIVVAGGCECITKFHLNGFNTLMILDSEPCKPFDANRNGINLGEGAAYVIMQKVPLNPPEGGKLPSFGGAGGGFPWGRGEVLCELSGYANTCDAFHQTASSPNGEGAYRAMKQALETAELRPSDIDYINAHGTGTENNDLTEGIAIMRLFGENPPPLSSTKAFTGHATSAAGSIEAVISILALQHNFMPVNLNFAEKMPELQFAPINTNKILYNKQLKHVLSNSFGFGGNDTSLIFSKVF